MPLISIDTFSSIHPLNVGHMQVSDRHSLYGNDEGYRLEIQSHPVCRVVGGISEKIGVILGTTLSWYDGGQSQTQILFVDSTGVISEIGEYSGLHTSSIEADIFYMFLNPISSLGGWVLLDLAEQKKNHAPETQRMIGMKSSWGKTETYHPDLEAAIAQRKTHLENYLV